MSIFFSERRSFFVFAVTFNFLFQFSTNFLLNCMRKICAYSPIRSCYWVQWMGIMKHILKLIEFVCRIDCSNTVASLECNSLENINIIQHYSIFVHNTSYRDEMLSAFKNVFLFWKKKCCYWLNQTNYLELSHCKRDQ